MSSLRSNGIDDIDDVVAVCKMCDADVDTIGQVGFLVL
jgi:hypothetical protein